MQAISILVDKWFAENTFHADEFKLLDELVELKRQQNLTISLALPALNEEETVGKVISMMKKELMEIAPLLDEIVLINSDSTDLTRDRKEGRNICLYPPTVAGTARSAKRQGRSVMEKSARPRGDIIVWMDTDIVNIHPRFVYGIIGPLLLDPQVQFVKGFYRRPLNVGHKMEAGGGGRVTELTPRPLLNLFYPELSGVVQPLAGEYAAGAKRWTRSVLFRLWRRDRSVD